MLGQEGYPLHLPGRAGARKDGERYGKFKDGEGICASSCLMVARFLKQVNLLILSVDLVR